VSRKPSPLNPLKSNTEGARPRAFWKGRSQLNAGVMQHQAEVTTASLLRTFLHASAVLALSLSCWRGPPAISAIPSCGEPPPLPPDWSRSSMLDPGASLAVPPTYSVSVAVPPTYTVFGGTLNAEGRAIGASEFERHGEHARDTMPPWACAIETSSGCERPSERCVVERQGRRVHIEMATLRADNPAGYNHTRIEDPAPEFRPYVVQAFWRAGPAHWHVVSGNSRDSAGQQELLIILRSVQFDRP
jgi:hypothetical protein